METLSIEGKEFVKASIIAREFKYTPDYVGQLCRGGKVDAQLVGRTWYVSRESLLDHKDSRYNKKISLASRLQNSSKPSRKGAANFYERASVKSTINYDTDSSDLIPSPVRASDNNSTRLPVSLADAKSVSIKSKDDTCDFEAPERKRVVFKGDLVVTEMPEIEFEEAEEETEEVEEIPVLNHKNPQNRQISQSSPLKSVVAAKVSSAKQLTNNKAKNASFDNTIKISDTDEQTSQTIKISYLLTSTVLAIFFVAVLFSVESTLYVTDQVVISEYYFNTDNLIAALYGSK